MRRLPLALWFGGLSLVLLGLAAVAARSRQPAANKSSRPCQATREQVDATHVADSTRTPGPLYNGGNDITARIQEDIWRPVISRVARYSRGRLDRSRVCEEIDALRTWVRNSETRSAFLTQAGDLFAAVHDGRPLLPEGMQPGGRRVSAKETVEVLTLVAFVVVENTVSQPDPIEAVCRRSATDYLASRWNAVTYEQEEEGLRYLFASLMYLGPVEMSQLSACATQALDNELVERDVQNALIEETCGATSTEYEQFFITYLSRADEEIVRSVGWVPKRIQYNRLEDRAARIEFLRQQLKELLSQGTSYGVWQGAGGEWVLDTIGGLNAREVLGELQAIVLKFDDEGKSTWFIARRAADLVVRFSP